MSHRGAGDLWMAGTMPDGVSFAQGAAVEVVAGPHAGEGGAVLLLLALEPEPRYLVRLASRGRDVRVRQSELRHAG